MEDTLGTQGRNLIFLLHFDRYLSQAEIRSEPLSRTGQKIYGCMMRGMPAAKSKSLRLIPKALLSYEGGDSELFNYLDYIITRKCVQIVST